MSIRPLLLPLLIPAVVLAILLAVSTWPTVNLAPRDLPVGVVAAPETLTRIQPGLTASGLDVRVLDGELAAIRAIDDRDIYGALVIDQTGTRLLIASAASPLIADLLRQAATQLTSTGNARLTVTDQVPPAAGDPRGIGFASAIQPVLIAGLASGVLAWRQRASRRQTTAFLLASTLLSALTAMLMLDGWLDVLSGQWLPVFAALWLSVLTVGALATGLSSVLGMAGTLMTVLIAVLVGGPLSGATSSPDLLPGWASVTGSLLPPGASATLLRGVAFFDGAGSLVPILVLTGWLVIGTALLWAPRRSASLTTKTVAEADRVRPGPIVDQRSTPAS